MASPILVHVHIPKCAGQWFDKVLWRMFGPRELWASMIPSGFGPVLMLEERKYRANIAEFERTLRGKPWVRAITSQKFIGSFPRELAGREARYATILRDPGEQAISFLGYIVKKYDNFHEGFRSKLPEGVRGADMLTAARLVLDERPGLLRHIMAVSYFAPETRDEGEAIANLESIDFVGTTAGAEALALRVARWATPDRDLARVLPPARVNVSAGAPGADEQAAAVRALPGFQQFLESRPARVSAALFERAKELEAEAAARDSADATQPAGAR